MTAFEATKSSILKAFDFSGRATRSEFWWFILFAALLHTLLLNLFEQPETGVALKLGFYLYLDTNAAWWMNFYTVVFALPLISLVVRRTHDIGYGGDKLVVAMFFLFSAFVLILKASPTLTTQRNLSFALLGIFVIGFLIAGFKKSQPYENRFGPHPLHRPNPNEVSS